ncbi:MAG: hypothetical protein R2773_06295 [Flavobacteriaceae bacterium]
MATYILIDLIYALRLNGFEGDNIASKRGGKCYNFGTAEKEVDADFCQEK